MSKRAPASKRPAPQAEPSDDDESSQDEDDEDDHLATVSPQNHAEQICLGVIDPPALNGDTSVALTGKEAQNAKLDLIRSAVEYLTLVHVDKEPAPLKYNTPEAQQEGARFRELGLAMHACRYHAEPGDEPVDLARQYFGSNPPKYDKKVHKEAEKQVHLHLDPMIAEMRRSSSSYKILADSVRCKIWASMPHMLGSSLGLPPLVFKNTQTSLAPPKTFKPKDHTIINMHTLVNIGTYHPMSALESSEKDCEQNVPNPNQASTSTSMLAAVDRALLQNVLSALQLQAKAAPQDGSLGPSGLSALPRSLAFEPTQTYVDSTPINPHVKNHKVGSPPAVWGGSRRREDAGLKAAPAAPPTCKIARARIVKSDSDSDEEEETAAPPPPPPPPPAASVASSSLVTPQEDKGTRASQRSTKPTKRATASKAQKAALKIESKVHKAIFAGVRCEGITYSGLREYSCVVQEASVKAGVWNVKFDLEEDGEGELTTAQVQQYRVDL